MVPFDLHQSFCPVKSPQMTAQYLPDQEITIVKQRIVEGEGERERVGYFLSVTTVPTPILVQVLTIRDKFERNDGISVSSLFFR